MDGRRISLDSLIRTYFDQAADAKRSRQQAPAYGFGFRLFYSIYHLGLVLMLSSLFLVFAILLEWTEEYPGGIRKPIPVRPLVYEVCQYCSLSRPSFGLLHAVISMTEGASCVVVYVGSIYNSSQSLSSNVCLRLSAVVSITNKQNSQGLTRLLLKITMGTMQ